MNDFDSSFEYFQLINVEFLDLAVSKFEGTFWIDYFQVDSSKIFRLLLLILFLIRVLTYTKNWFWISERLLGTLSAKYVGLFVSSFFAYPKKWRHIYYSQFWSQNFLLSNCFSRKNLLKLLQKFSPSQLTSKIYKK